MQNSDKFKILQGIEIFETTTNYLQNELKKHISDKYYSTGIINAEELESVYSNLPKGYLYVDLILPSYDQETVDAAAEEFNPLGIIYSGVTVGVQSSVVNTKIPLYNMRGSSLVSEETIDIYAKFDSSTKDGIKIYHQTGWGDSSKNAEIDQNTRQRGNSFMWSFINWVCYYIHTMIKRLDKRATSLETWKRTATNQIKDLQTFQAHVTEQFQNYNQQLLDLTNRVTALEKKQS